MTFFHRGSDPERRRTQWDLEAGPANYLALLGGQLGSAALSFASVWLAVRALGSEGYGGIVALIAGSQLVGQTAVQWTAIAVFRHGCQEFVDRGRIAAAFWNRLAILAANLLLLGLLARWWLPWICALLSIPPDGGKLVVIHLLTTSLAVHAQQSLQAAKLPRFQSLLQLLERGAVAMVLMTSILFGATTWWTAAALFSASPLLTAVLACWRLRHLIFPLPGLDASLIREMLRFSYPLIFFSFVGYFTTNHLDAIIVLRHLSASDLGVYATAYQLTGVFMQLASLLGTLFMAFLITADAEGDRARLERFFHSILPTLTLVSSTFAAVATIAGSLLLDALFPDAFRDGPLLLWPLLAAAALAAPVTVAFGPVANARSRTSIAAISAVAAALTNTFLNLVLIPTFGLMGCAWATTAAFGASLLVFLLLAPRVVATPSSWTLCATLPMLAGAVVGAGGRQWHGLAVTVLTAVVIGLVRLRDVRSALRALAALPAIDSLFIFSKSTRARAGVP
jgi:O-antigen/teichoic acid export membrane protein